MLHSHLQLERQWGQPSLCSASHLSAIQILNKDWRKPTQILGLVSFSFFSLLLSQGTFSWTSLWRTKGHPFNVTWFTNTDWKALNWHGHWKLNSRCKLSRWVTEDGPLKVSTLAPSSSHTLCPGSATTWTATATYSCRHGLATWPCLSRYDGLQLSDTMSLHSCSLP